MLLRIVPLLPASAVLLVALAHPHQSVLRREAVDEPAQETATPEFPAAAESVVVDFVVRDKAGSLLRDLAPSDVEVYEDGKRQQIDSFRRVERGPISANERSDAGHPAAVPGSAAGRGVSSEGGTDRPYAALVFDRLGPTARTFACQQALAWLKEPRNPAWIGVFRADQVLETVLPFSEDLVAVRRAVEKTQTMTRTSHNVREDRERLRNLRMMANRSPAAGTVAADFGAEMRVLAAEVDGDIEAEGRTTLGAVLALVNALAPVPGRKAVILFSEGLSLPTAADSMFESLVAGANRANVSIYAMDAGGLRTMSGNEDMRRDMLDLRQTVESSESGGSNLGVLIRNEENLRMPAEGGLGRLAEGTGGTLARDTNTLGPSLKRVEEDLSAYFVLAYSPTNASFDGRFRKISLKIRRPYGSLQARQGYFAVRSKELPTPVLAHEAPALSLLERREGASAVPIRLRVLEIPVAQGDSRVVVLAEVEGKSVRSVVDLKAHLYRQDFTIVFLFRDRAGRIVRKLSQRFQVNGRAERLEDARKAKTLSYRQTELPPGPYAVEAAVWDALADAGGVTRSALEISEAAGDRPRLGSLMVLRHAEPAGENLDPDHPLRYGDVLLYPNLGEPLSRHSSRQVAFFLAARTPGAVPAWITVANGSGGAIERTLTSTTPGADGIAHFVGSLPIESLASGEYELRLTVGAADAAQTRRAPFKIVD